MYTRLFEGQIIFYFAQDVLFDNVKHQSAFMCKNIVSKDGEDLSERFAITDDEADMFALCLRETLPSIYDQVKGITYGVTDAFTDGMLGSTFKAIFTDATPSEKAALGVDDAKNYVVIRVQDNGAYNDNDLRQADSALQTAIEGGTIATFYTRVTHPDLTKLSDGVAAGQLVILAKRLVPLRKKSVL